KLTKMEPITATLRQEASFARGARCASCRRTGPTTRALPKCTHCGLRIGGGDPGFVAAISLSAPEIPRQIRAANHSRISRRDLSASKFVRRYRQIFVAYRRRHRGLGGQPPISRPVRRDDLLSTHS